MLKRQHPFHSAVRALYSRPLVPPGRVAHVVSSRCPPTGYDAASCSQAWCAAGSQAGQSHPPGESICRKYSNSSSAFFPFPRVKFFHPHLLTLSLLGMFVFLASFLNFFHPAEECLIPSEVLKPRPSPLARRSVRIYRKQNKPSDTCLCTFHI